MCTENGNVPFAPIPFAGKRWQTPEASAAYYGELDELQRLFAKGYSPNSSLRDVISPLEAAILGGQKDCAALILSHSSFDSTPTEVILDALAHNGTEDAVTACCKLVAPIVLGCEFDPFAKEPLPAEITLPRIIRAGNWILLVRFLTFHCVENVDRRQIAAGMNWRALEEVPMYGIRLLSKLLEQCGDLMRHRAIRQCFCALALSNSIGIPQELRPFVHLLPERVVLTQGSFSNWGGAGNLLSRWRSHFGMRTSPRLDLKKRLPDNEPTEQMVEHLLRVCEITGRIPRGKPSPLLVDIFAYASNETLRTQLQPGGALSCVEREAMERAARAFLVSAERRMYIEKLLKGEYKDARSNYPAKN